MTVDEVLRIALVIIGTLVTTMGGMFLSRFTDLTNDFKELRRAIETLNISFVAVVEKVNTHGASIQKHEDRIERLEESI